MMSKNTKRKLIILYGVFLHLIVLVLLALSLLSGDRISLNQAKSIAYGEAMKECLNSKQSQDCKSLTITSVESLCFEWYCRDTPIWIMQYQIKGVDAGEISIDRTGKIVK